MNENIKLQMNPSVKKQYSIRTSVALFSQDIDNYSFDITFTDLKLQAGDQIEVLAKLQGGKLEHKSSANLVEVDGEFIARYVFDTKLIDRKDYVFCYVYLKRGDKSADVGAFFFEVDLSELDKVGGKIAEVYDGRYEDLVAEFEIRLQEYCDSLPQADSVRAEIDVVLNQFGMDGQAKLSQYDADAQQVITDNQVAFNLAESVQQEDFDTSQSERHQQFNDAQSARQESYEQTQLLINEAEESRVQAEGQRKSAESGRVEAEGQRVQAENERQSAEQSRQTTFETNESERDGTFNANEATRQGNESTRQQAETQRESAESIRVNTEEQRKIDHANRSAELDGKADKIVLKNFIENGDFSDGISGWRDFQDRLNIEFIEDFVRLEGTFEGARIEYRFEINPDDKVYYSVSTRSVNVIDSSMGVGTSLAIDRAFTHSEDWVNESGIYSIASGNLSIIVRAVGNILDIRHVIAINLTQTFGGGNEPTKTEMDEIIKITGYFDEIALTNKQLLNWQLKLMRQNRNALIALGGTII